jgi:hypothetical protein
LTLKSFFNIILKDESVVATNAMTIQASIKMTDFSASHWLESRPMLLRLYMCLRKIVIGESVTHALEEYGRSTRVALFWTSSTVF